MTWNRLIASTLAFFALMTGVLAWRVRTGHDPALTSGQTTAAVHSGSGALTTRSSPAAGGTTSTAQSGSFLATPPATTHES